MTQETASRSASSFSRVKPEAVISLLQFFEPFLVGASVFSFGVHEVNVESDWWDKIGCGLAPFIDMSRDTIIQLRYAPPDAACVSWHIAKK